MSRKKKQQVSSGHPSLNTGSVAYRETAARRPAAERRPRVSVGKLFAEALALYKHGKLAQAATACEAVLRAGGNHYNVLHLLGVVRAQQGNQVEALSLMEEAVRCEPNVAEAHNNLGTALKGLKRPEEAVASFRRALELRPDYPEAHNNLGSALKDLKRPEEAIASYRRALELRPDYPEAHYNLGNALKDLKRPEEAIASYRRALALRPDFPGAYHNLGNALRDLKRPEEAIASYRRALALQPDDPYARGPLADVCRRVCDWSGYAKTERDLRAHVRLARSVVHPFFFLAYSGDPKEQLRCAQLWVQDRIGSGLPRIPRDKLATGKRLRIAYLSADFHEHATAYLMAELFERHDRERFEVFGFSYGPNDKSVMRGRLEAAFDQFIDVRAMSDERAARQIAELGIQVAVDLKGYTRDARVEILAHYPAPIQVNYLGFPGTMGADFIDYILVDPIVVPAAQQPFYTEKLVHLPDCYQVNDSQREIATHTPSRAECRLPEDVFVFCCFNNNYKITPAVFDVWMRLLEGVSRGVLWLLSDNEVAERNLRREAQARGVDPVRLIFAPRLQLADHLARYRVADLFLDTLPYNGHTTASDALWAGLPVLTCAGSAFAGRVAGSLLHAVGLPELVTGDLEAYEALALKLATDPALLGNIRERLAQNRTTAPLFDIDRFRQHIEAAYKQMWRIWESGEAPKAFAVKPRYESVEGRWDPRG